MEEVLQYLNMVVDNRQEKKVLHKMSDIIALVFFALLSNHDIQNRAGGYARRYRAQVHPRKKNDVANVE